MNFSRPSIFLALALQTAAHAGINLLANPSAQDGATAGWNIVANGGDGWTTRGDSVDGDGASFITSYNWCTLLLKRDDGVVVYRNGTEIVCDNFPGGPIAFDTPATSAPDDGQQFHSFSVDPDLLVEGGNVLAVEIHQVNLTSSDASFDLELIAETPSKTFGNALFEIVDNQMDRLVLSC